MELTCVPRLTFTVLSVALSVEAVTDLAGLAAVNLVTQTITVLVTRSPILTVILKLQDKIK